MVLETIAPSVGDVTETVGDDDELLTFTVTPELVVEIPAVSRAVAVKV
jgi:hypothetical protein